MRGVAVRAWIPLLLVVVLAVSGLIVMRLHKVFGSQDLNATWRKPTLVGGFSSTAEQTGYPPSKKP
jgi:hypothetical protein